MRLKMKADFLESRYRNQQPRHNFQLISLKPIGSRLCAIEIGIGHRDYALAIFENRKIERNHARLLHYDFAILHRPASYHTIQEQKPGNIIVRAIDYWFNDRESLGWIDQRIGQQHRH